MQWYQEVADVLVRRVGAAGLAIHNDHKLVAPPLPDEWKFVFEAHSPSHRCEDELYADLPLVLVVDVQIEEARIDSTASLRIWQAKRRFSPYWLVGVRIVHDHAPYPGPINRFANPIEAACIFAQHPRFGSVKSHLGKHWGHGSVQIYRCPKRGRAVVSSYGLGPYNHHAALCVSSIHHDDPLATETFDFEPQPVVVTKADPQTPVEQGDPVLDADVSPTEDGTSPEESPETKQAE